MDNYGMWVKLDAASHPSVISESGAGLAVDYPPVARYTLDELIAEIPTDSVSVAADEVGAMEQEGDISDDYAAAAQAEPSNVGEVMAWARDHIARLTGMKSETIKLNLKIEY